MSLRIKIDRLSLNYGLLSHPILKEILVKLPFYDRFYISLFNNSMMMSPKEEFDIGQERIIIRLLNDSSILIEREGLPSLCSYDANGAIECMFYLLGKK